jgi:hypothetical protein
MAVECDDAVVCTDETASFEFFSLVPRMSPAKLEPDIQLTRQNLPWTREWTAKASFSSATGKPAIGTDEPERTSVAPS